MKDVFRGIVLCAMTALIGCGPVEDPDTRESCEARGGAWDCEIYVGPLGQERSACDCLEY